MKKSFLIVHRVLLIMTIRLSVMRQRIESIILHYNYFTLQGGLTKKIIV